MSSFVPEGYGVYDQFDEEGFDFGDSFASGRQQGHFEPTMSSLVSSPKQRDNNGQMRLDQGAGSIEMGIAEVQSTPNSEMAQEQSLAQEVSPLSELFLTPGVPQPPVAVVPQPPVAGVETGNGVVPSKETFSPTHGFKKGRFSPSLPRISLPRSRQSRQQYMPRSGQNNMRSKYKVHSSDGQPSDPRAKSRILEKGEELKVAINHGNVKIVKEIMSSGFDPNMLLNSGWTPLMHACDRGHSEVVEYLLASGAHPNIQKDQFTALMAVCANTANKNAELVACAQLLINKGGLVNSHDRHHMSPLLYACQNGHLQLAELLLSANADIHKQDSRDWTALSYAASKGHLQTVQLLVKHNANPEAVSFSGDTPSLLALEGGHTAVSDWLDSVTSSQTSVNTHVASLPSHPLPSHPLLEGVRMTNTSLTSGNSDSLSHEGDTLQKATELDTPASSGYPTSVCVQYGDLELFLLGLQLGDLLPVFRRHHVQFSNLLSMTEKDLETMGVTQVGLRKRVLDGIVDIHQRQWDMPKSSSLPYGRVISSSEAIIILSHLTRHTHYINSTARYLLNHVVTNPEMIDVHMESSEVDKLTNELAGVVEAVTTFRDEISALNSEMCSLLPPLPDESQRRSASGDSSNRNKKLVNGVKVVCVVAMVSVASYVVYHKLT